jgi:predicted RecA/RadA family phage recombinase
MNPSKRPIVNWLDKGEDAKVVRYYGCNSGGEAGHGQTFVAAIKAIYCGDVGEIPAASSCFAISVAAVEVWMPEIKVAHCAAVTLWLFSMFVISVVISVTADGPNVANSWAIKAADIILFGDGFCS